ncbi:putative NASP-related protein Sim3p [[Candida] jaroonii]|uniref:NASP-related protein Sim3p n=1 Tax=[Candida] jaroonii TaxID=467808 RepID=A0ACA9Y672_9ASCO|nr:putative NASP-related protein Sim3p [[Candida] jaroonii]
MSYSEEVEKLLKSGAKNLGEKNYEQAVEDYSKACGLHQEETGEIEPDLFMMYGKALYESGVSQSDVLGGQEITSEKIEEAKGEDDDEGDAFQFNDLAAEEFAEAGGEEEEQSEEEEGPSVEEDEEEEQGEEQEEQEEEKTDMELAWEILEIARGLYEKKLDDNKAEESKLTIPYLTSDKDTPTNEYVKTLKSLSEVYDLLGEVSLESEHFPQAASDLESSLEMRKKLYDNDYSGLIGESHFKLSLALEFCLEDDTAKEKAANHIKAAIKILKNDSQKNPDKKKENDEIIGSLSERLDEIGSNAEDAINKQKQDMLQDILGSSKGTELLVKLSSSPLIPTPGPSKVNDLTSMVKKRKSKSKDNNVKRTKK